MSIAGLASNLVRNARLAQRSLLGLAAFLGAAGPLLAARPSEISGVLNWPDGKPAQGARVVAEDSGFDFLASSLPFFPAAVRTDASGAFRIRALEGGPRTVRATIDPPESSPRPSVAYLPWTATVTDVALGTRGLALTLESGSRLRGRAVDDRGEPLRSFVVELIEVLEVREGSVTSSRARPVELQSADGSFEIHGIQRGTWEIVLDSEGCVAAPKLALTLPAEIPPHDFVAPRAARVTGLVVDPSGAPVVRARVRLSRPGERVDVRFPSIDLAGKLVVDPEPASQTRSGRAQRDGECTTDAGGRFEFDHARPGRQLVRAWAPGHATSIVRALDLQPGGRIDDLRIALRRGATVRGIVRDPRGRPLAGVDVGVIVDGESEWQTTGNDGRFVFEHVTPGSVLLAAREELEPGQATRLDPPVIEKDVTAKEGEDIDVSLGGSPAAARIRVTGVLRGALSVANAKVRFAPSRDGGDGVQVRADGEGRYELELTERGEHWVVLHLPSDSLAERSVTIGPGDHQVIDLELPGTLLSGRVVDPGGRPLVARLRARRTDLESSTGGWSTVATDTSSPDGSFVFEGLERGPWRLGVSPKEGTAARGVLASQHLLVDLARESRVEGLVVRLERGGSIEGVVRGPGGQPVVGARVTARGADGFDFDHESPAEERCATDAAGRYVLADLAPGAWQVRAVGDMLASRDSAALSVAAGGRERVDLAVEPAGFLEIRLADAQGDAMNHGPGEWTRVLDASGRAWHDLEEERYGELVRRFGPLPPGSWIVRRGDATIWPEVAVEVRAGEGRAVVLQPR